MELKTGTVLNEIYRTVKLLGKGAMGNVYLVERIKDDKQFVVKELIFDKSGSMDKEMVREIFLREAAFMEKFKHPGLPKTFGTFSQGGRDYLVMDYIEGKTLEEIIRESNNPISEDKAVKWIIEICKIIDYLHNYFEKPIVYRDLKPSNIIITPNNRVKLVDFGIARYYNPDKNTDTFSCGSPGYAAPEQYKGRGQSSPRTDVFGLGVILFQMVTKYDPTLKPFTFPPLKLSEKRLENIIKRAIELEPERRYISIKEFQEELEKYLGIYKKPSEKPFLYRLSVLSRIMIIIAIFGIFAGNMFIALTRGTEYIDFSLEILIWAIIIFITFSLRVIINLIINIKNKTLYKYSLLTKVFFILTAVIVLGNTILMGLNIIDSYAQTLEDHILTVIYCNCYLIFLAVIIWFFLKGLSYATKSIDGTYSYDRYTESSDCISSGEKIILILSSLTIVFVLTIILNKAVGNLGFKGIEISIENYFSYFRQNILISMIFLIIPAIFILPFTWSFLHLSRFIYKSLFSEKRDRREPAEFKSAAPGILLLYIILSYFFINFCWNSNSAGYLAACESNIKCIASALEIYSEENSGNYPASLDYLTEKSQNGTSYMKAIPHCPICNGSYIYNCNNDTHNFTIWCGTADSHSLTNTTGEGCWPQYTPYEGMKLK